MTENSSPLPDSDAGSLGCALGMAGGMLGVALVLLGAAFETPNFCVRTGYVGAGFLSKFLYSVGDDTFALAVVSALWFGYLGIPFAAAGALLGIHRGRRRGG